MSLKTDRKRIRGKLARLEHAEMLARRRFAFSAAEKQTRQWELDAIVAERKQWQELLAKQVQHELTD